MTTETVNFKSHIYPHEIEEIQVFSEDITSDIKHLFNIASNIAHDGYQIDNLIHDLMVLSASAMAASTSKQKRIIWEFVNQYMEKLINIISNLENVMDAKTIEVSTLTDDIEQLENSNCQLHDQLNSLRDDYDKLEKLLEDNEKDMEQSQLSAWRIQ